MQKKTIRLRNIVGVTCIYSGPVSSIPSRLWSIVSNLPRGMGNGVNKCPKQPPYVITVPLYISGPQ